jgi:phage FluMu gp28-like protein
MHTFDVVEQERFNQLDWNIQKARIETFWHRYNKGDVYIDSTGVGSPIFDDLDARGISVIPYTFTQKSREDLLQKLVLAFERGQIGIPNSETLIEELEAFQYVPRGDRLKMEVPEGQHDDCVMSLALANWGLPQNKLPINKKYAIKKLTQGKPSQY